MLPSRLLAADEPPAATIIKGSAASPFLLLCDHASNRIPRRLGTLGLSNHDRERHIAWDIGAAVVTRLMADTLGATAILQNYSRLVIDCNRPISAADSIVEVSEYVAILDNRALPEAERELRQAEVFHPYHARIQAEISLRRDQKAPTALVSLHSFTPVFKGERRNLHIGVLYNRDNRIAHPLMNFLRRAGDLHVGDNEPYALSDESDYTLPVHGEQRGLPHVEIEVRQDLISDGEGQRKWAQLLTQALVTTWQGIESQKNEIS